MKRYMLFIFLIGMIARQTYGSPATFPEIAINMQGKPLKKGKKVFLPITIYEGGILKRGGFIKLHSVAGCTDTDLVFDTSENGLRTNLYICNQSLASEKQSFASAVDKILAKIKKTYLVV